jgi:metal-responsive CopG/Arc/MetJ family transcriptional regulator
MATAPKEVQVTFRIPGELAEMLDQHVERTRTNRSWVIRDALHRYFDGMNHENGNDQKLPH